MEHIIQFGVSIDDDKIEKMVMQKAADELMKQIKNETSEFAKEDWVHQSKLKNLFKEEVKDVIERNKETIIEKVIKEIVTNMMKTKAIVEAKQRIVDSVGE